MASSFQDAAGSSGPGIQSPSIELDSGLARTQPSLRWLRALASDASARNDVEAGFDVTCYRGNGRGGGSWRSRARRGAGRGRARGHWATARLAKTFRPAGSTISRVYRKQPAPASATGLRPTSHPVALFHGCRWHSGLGSRFIFRPITSRLFGLESSQQRLPWPSVLPREQDRSLGR